MTWVSRQLGKAGASLARKYGTLDLFRDVFGGRESSSGAVVNVDAALGVTTVLACCRVIANGVAQVPWRVYQSVDGQTLRANDHALSRLISRRPNMLQTSFELRQTLMFHALLTGNAYAWKRAVGSRRIVRAIEPIEPHRVTVEYSESGGLNYKISADDGMAVTAGQDEIWHLRNVSWNNYQGMDGLKLARDAIGLSIATSEAHAKFHKGGAKVSGVLSLSEQIGAEKFGHLAAWLDAHSDGGEREGKPLVLDSGAKWSSTQMTGVDAQHLETRKHQIEEICRAFGVFPQMVGHAGDQSPTFASAEAFFTAHVIHTLAPWYEAFEQSADASLLSDEDVQAGYYTKFIPNGLMRGNAMDRAGYYAQALGSGGHPAWMTQNDVRGLEEMDPVAGGDQLSPGASMNGADDGTP